MAIPVKPVKIKQTGAVSSPTPVKVKQVETQTTNSQTETKSVSNDEGYDILFGQKPIETSNPVDDVKNDKDKKVKEKSDKSVEKLAEKSKKEDYTGPRIVKVYGQTLFTENDPKVTLEDIRNRIEKEFGFDEFSASRTEMSLDETTGIVVPNIRFQKKG